MIISKGDFLFCIGPLHEIVSCVLVWCNKHFFTCGCSLGIQMVARGDDLRVDPTGVIWPWSSHDVGGTGDLVCLPRPSHTANCGSLGWPGQLNRLTSFTLVRLVVSFDISRLSWDQTTASCCSFCLFKYSPVHHWQFVFPTTLVALSRQVIIYTSISRCRWRTPDVRIVTLFLPGGICP